MKQSNKDLTSGSVPKKLSNLTLPMMIGILSMVAFNLIDTYFVGKLGSLQLAALSFTFPVIMVIFSIIQGLGIGATAIISKSIGKNDHEQAARETTDSLVLSVVVAGFFIGIGLFTVEDTFRLLGASDEIMPYVTEYMTIWYVAIFFVIIPYIGNSAIRATGDARTPSMIMVFAVLINAILDPLLIFGYGPFPALGLKGAAMATAISRGITMVFALLILYYREHLIVLKIQAWKSVVSSWKAILSIGIPSGISRTIIPLSTGVVTSLLANHGEFIVAGYGVATRVEFLANSLLFALSASIGPFTGQNFGAGNFYRIRTGVLYSNGFSIAWGVLIAIVLFAFGKPFASVFTEEPEVIEATHQYLKIVAITFGFQGVVQIVNSNLNTLNKPLAASAIVFIQMIIIGIPLFYLFDHLYGVTGVYTAVAITYFIGGLLSVIFNRKIIKNMQIQFDQSNH